jgi:ribosomal protein L35
MPKLKTNKAVSKKIKITGRGKALRQYTKQNHFNSRETGKFKRFKRRDKRLSRANERNVLKALPYN